MQIICNWTSRLVVIVLIILIFNGAAFSAPTNRYVSMPGIGGHQSPYTNWAMAATSINAAVTLANTYNEGDTVWIAAGHYVLTQTVSVGNTQARGFTGNPDDVIVDGNGAYRCFTLTNDNAFLANLTATNGYNGGNGDSGGVLFGNAGAGSGVVSNCVIVNCSVLAYGGGIYSQGATVTVLRSRIAGNSAQIGAGGIRFITGYLRDCTISCNTGTSGAIDCIGTNQCVSHCVISGNVAVSGGGVYIGANASPVISNCIVVNNFATNGGGFGMTSATSKPRIYNCLIANNTGKTYGGGIYWYSTSAVYNCTIVSNTSYGFDNFWNDCPFTMVNTIVYSNKTGSYRRASATNYMTNCCSPGLSGNNNLSAYPKFADLTQGDYRLQDGSPCINAGTNIEGMAGTLDLDGHPRLDRFSRKVDMGAYEFVPEGMLFIGK